MAASENGLFFVHEFKSIYTEYTIEMIVPEGYVARFVTSLAKEKILTVQFQYFSWLVPRPFDRGLTLLERRVIYTDYPKITLFKTTPSYIKRICRFFAIAILKVSI